MGECRRTGRPNAVTQTAVLVAEKNKYALCIVDGMGTGKPAAEQSKRISATVRTNDK